MSPRIPRKFDSYWPSKCALGSVSGMTWVAIAVLLATPVLAQTVYRVVGPDGTVTFADKPPATAAKVTAVDGIISSTKPAAVALPFELRQVVGKYPVTLYSSANCAPCDAGRALLSSRGVPFIEKTVSSNEDADALQALSGANSLPFLTIGAQQIRGFSIFEWKQYLDAAAYPPNSVLPAGYHRLAATPLVETPKPESAKPAVPASAAASASFPLIPPAAAVHTEANPAGIQF